MMALITNSKITDESSYFQTIQTTPVSNMSLLKSEPPKGFSKSPLDGDKCILMVLSNENEQIINGYLEEEGFANFYKSKILKQESSMKNIIEAIYEKLGVDKNEEIKEVFSEETDNFELMADNTTLIKTTIEKAETEPIIKEETENSSIDGFISPSDFISGKIVVENDSRTNLEGIKVKLIQDFGENKTTVRTTASDGSFSFGYPIKIVEEDDDGDPSTPPVKKKKPAPGRYKLEFIFERRDRINGQYYEVKSGLEKTNEIEINKEFYTITYKEEEKLDENKMKILKGETYLNVPFIDIENGESITDDDKIEKFVILAKRDPFSLTIEQKINDYRIVLSNGQVYNKYSEEKPFYNISIEDNLRYGARLFIEFKLTVENNSNIDCEGFEILNRFENLEYESNSNDKWKLLKTNDVYIKYPLEKIRTKELEHVTYIKLTEDEQIQRGKKKEYYITLQRDLDAGDECLFSTTSEIISYSNNEGRRNYSQNSNEAEFIIQSANYYENNIYGEKDTDTSETVAVLPPTGGNNN